MRRNDFSATAPGTLVELPAGPLVPAGTFAFVPAPLPPRLDLSQGTWLSLTEANGALGELRGTVQQLPNPELLVGPLLNREAVITSRIEGTIASVEQVALLQADPASKSASPSAQEVVNYLNALRFGLDWISRNRVDQILIKRMHQLLMEGVRGQEARPGEYRSSPNYIRGAGSASINDARYVPPPVMAMANAMDRLEAYLQAPGTLHGLIDLALIHYQFEAIHPFQDGNGRIGRALLTLLLCERQILSQPWLHLSAYFEAHRDEYYDLLLKISQAGAWEDWIKFFLGAIAEQSRDAIQRANKLIDLRNEFRRTVQAARRSALLPDIVDRLFTSPAVTIPLLQRQLGITYRGAQQLVERLVTDGILTELDSASGVRTFYALRIINLIA